MNDCKHEEVEVEKIVEDNMGFDGYYQTESECYVCVACGEITEGNPAEDRADMLADIEMDRDR